MNFTDYQNQVSSEKIVLATLDAAKRLMGWVLDSGSIYKLVGIEHAFVVSIEDSGTAYTAAANAGAVTAGKYFLDRATQTLYVRASDSSNPNSRYLVGTFRLFLANAPISLAYDLATGYEVPWQPLVEANSAFGVEIDTVNQTSVAIEGSGSLTIINDQDFWPANFDKLIFENQSCSIYSFNRDLAASEARLLFRGKVEKRSYKSDQISFQLKDIFSELKAPVVLNYIEDLGELHSDSVAKAYQRMIFGRVFGFRPTNIDTVRDGYPIPSVLVSITNGSTTLNGSSGFRANLSRDDKLLLGGVEYTIASVTNDITAQLTESYTGSELLNSQAYIIPNRPKRYINRYWKVAGHALCQPTTTTQANCTPTRIFLNSTTGMFAGDKIYIGTLGAGELVIIENVVSSNLVELATSVLDVPAAGVAVVRPAIQNLRINDLELLFDRDFSINATNGTFTLLDTAESNACQIRQIPTSLTFSSLSRTVSGTGLDTIFKPGDMVSKVGETAFFEIMDVTETTLTLVGFPTFTGSGLGLYKNVIFDPSEDVITCDVLGRTSDGTSAGSLIRTGPAIVQTLLTDAGLASQVDSAAFVSAAAMATQDIGYVIPEKYEDKKLPTYREAINVINKSILGSLIQSDNFLISYFIIQPLKSSSSLNLKEADILSFAVDSNAQHMIKTAIVEYQTREYDYLIEDESTLTQQKTSNVSNYILKTDKEKTFSTKLVNTSDALIYANRWAFILENTSGVIKLKTKLQAANIEVGDVIDIEHRKLFVRFGGTDTRRLVMVQKVMKDGYSVDIEAVDLSNAFNRCANITSNTCPNYSASENADLLIGGYITDTYGMQNNDPDTYGTNLIW